MRDEPIIRAINLLRPGASWSMTDADFSTLIWLDRTQTTPTLDEVNAAIASLPSLIPSVTPRQARLALKAAGLLDKVTAAVAAADQATQITWEFASQIDRNSPVSATLGAQLGLTSAQIDALFIQASTL
jgi:hypothetical protein